MGNSCLITLTLCSMDSNKSLLEGEPEGLQGLTDTQGKAEGYRSLLLSHLKIWRSKPWERGVAVKG